MQASDRAAFGQLLTDVMAYYRQDTSGFVLDLWWRACANADMEQVRAALQKHCLDPERGQFAPKVADVVRALFGTATNRAAIAWGKAHGAMASVGAYRDVVFDDPLIHAVIEDLGGWPKVCRTTVDDLSYLQHRFQEAYRSYVACGAQADYPRRLAGDRSPDSDYEAKGLPAPRPVLIGVPELAQQVLLGGRVGNSMGIARQAMEALS